MQDQGKRIPEPGSAKVGTGEGSTWNPWAVPHSARASMWQKGSQWLRDKGLFFFCLGLGDHLKQNRAQGNGLVRKDLLCKYENPNLIPSTQRKSWVQQPVNPELTVCMVDEVDHDGRVLKLAGQPG